MAAAVLFATLSPTSSRAAPRVRYDGDTVVVADLSAVDETVLEQLTTAGVETLADHRSTTPMLRVPAVSQAALDASGVPYTLIDMDLQASLDAERLRLASRSNTTADGYTFYDDFRDWDEVQAKLDALAAHDTATVVEVGTSLHGRAIRGLKIERDPDAPVMLINACQHAREWLTVSTALAVAEAFVLGPVVPFAPNDRADLALQHQIDTLLDRMTVVIVPVVNPDGYVHTWEIDRLWRKNRREDHGVDLNRNWATAWGGPGGAADRDSNNYRGTSALSEPETAALSDWMLGQPNLTVHVDVHSYGQLVLYPWGFGETMTPDDDVLAPIAAQVAEVLSTPYDKLYTPRQAGTWYAASGNMMDWAYGALGLRSFTFELRPREVEESSQGFAPGPAAIVPTAHEALLGVLALGHWAAPLPPLAPGDDGDEPQPVLDDTGDGEATATNDDGTGPALDDEGTVGGEPAGSESSDAQTGQAGADADPSDAPTDGCQCVASTGSAPAAGWLWPLLLVATRRRVRTNV